MIGLSIDFENSLAKLDQELARAAQPVICGVEAEIAALTERRDVAKLVDRLDLVLKIEEAIAERAQRLEKIRGVFLRAAPLPSLVLPRKEVPIEAPKPPKVAQVPAGPVAVVKRRRDLADDAVTEISAPAVVEAPKPNVPPPPPPKPDLTRSQFLRLSQSLHAEEGAYLAERTWNNAREARLKSLVCQVRGLLVVAPQLDQDLHNLQYSFEELKNVFNEYTDFSPFFGFNETRYHRYSVWESLADAYEHIAVAEECLAWLDEHEVSDAERREMILGCGATEAWLHRLVDEHGLGVTDNQQRDLHHRIEALSADIYVPWWKGGGDGHIKTDDVIKAAKSLVKNFAASRTRIESRKTKESAMEALMALAESTEADGPLEETLIPAIRNCLEAKVPPSDKHLVELCLPYRAAIKEVGEPLFNRLLEFVQREITLRLKRMLPIEADIAEEKLDSQHTERFLAVKAYVEGKTLMFVGGRRIAEKAVEVENALGVKLLWPDAEPDTLMHDFAAPAMKSDIVCYLIRWSRHGYKNVIDFARKEGKDTVVIKAGIGINRLVHDIYEQLIAPKLASGE